jgi:hypothetical protein
MGKSYRRSYDEDYEDNYSKRDNKKKTRNYENALRQKDVQKLMKYDDDYEERN